MTTQFLGITAVECFVDTLNLINNLNVQFMLLKERKSFNFHRDIRDDIHPRGRETISARVLRSSSPIKAMKGNFKFIIKIYLVYLPVMLRWWRYWRGFKNIRL